MEWYALALGTTQVSQPHWSSRRPRSTSSAYRKKEGSKPPTSRTALWSQQECAPAGPLHTARTKLWTSLDLDAPPGTTRVALQGSIDQQKVSQRRAQARLHAGTLGSVGSGANEGRRDGRSAGMRCSKGHEFSQGARLQARIRVQQEPPLPRRSFEALIAGSAEADVLAILKNDRIWDHGARRLTRTVPRPVVDRGSTSSSRPASIAFS